jgi:hypothetical protein
MHYNLIELFDDKQVSGCCIPVTQTAAARLASPFSAAAEQLPTPAYVHHNSRPQQVIEFPSPLITSLLLLTPS